MANPDEVSIGNFDRPIVPPRPAQAKPGAPQPAAPVKVEGETAQRLDAAERKIAEEMVETDKTLSPLEAYEQKLKEAGLTLEEARAIYDAILQKGFWSETVDVSSSLKVKFRTRQLADTERFQREIERTRPAYESNYNEVLFKYSLAASLEQFGPTKFMFPTDETTLDDAEKYFQRRLDFLGKKPDPLVRLLYQKLTRFDLKVTVATSEGGVENF